MQLANLSRTRISFSPNAELDKQAVPEARHSVMTEPEGVNLILVTSKPLEEAAS